MGAYLCTGSKERPMKLERGKDKKLFTEYKINFEINFQTWSLRPKCIKYNVDKTKLSAVKCRKHKLLLKSFSVEQ